MEVIIAGAGSIGLLLGSYLSEAGMNVTFYVRREEQAELIRTEGIQRINQDGTTDVFHVQCDNGYSESIDYSTVDCRGQICGFA